MVIGYTVRNSDGHCKDNSLCSITFHFINFISFIIPHPHPGDGLGTTTGNWNSNQESANIRKQYLE